MSWFETLRKATATGIWSQGVRAARIPNSVVVEKRTDSEIVARVRSMGNAVAPTVTLYLMDEEWTCDCGSPVDPCAHIATVAVSVHQGTVQVASEAPAPTVNQPSTPTTATAAPVRESARSQQRKLGYCLWSDPQGLALSRVLVAADASATPLRASLHHPGSRDLVREIMPREQDLTLDRLIGSALGRYRLGPTQAAVMVALQGAPHVVLDNCPISISTDALLPEVRVVDSPQGVSVVFERPQELDRVVGTGLGLARGTLRPLGETEISGPRWERLPSSRSYAPQQFGDLVTHVLPQLRRRMIVNIETQRLPGLTRRVPPTIAFDIRSEGESLVALAHIVYGAPVIARVEHGRLIQVGDTAPKRDLDAENELKLKLRADLDMLVDRPFHLQGVDAARFSQRLMQWQKAHGDASNTPCKFDRVELRPELDFRDRTLSLRFVSAEGTDAVQAQVVLKAYQEGLEQIPLPSGAWGALPQGWLAQHANQLGDLLVARSADGELAKAAQVAVADFCQNAAIQLPEGLDAYAALLSSGLPESTLPSDWVAELRPYQRIGVNWLSALKSAGLGAILADDMGLGKTVQTLGVLGKRTLLVCPRSVMHNWVAETRRFRPSLKTCVYHGPERQFDEAADLTVTTYALLRMDIEQLRKLHFDAVVLDEAQAIKNPGSLAAEAAVSLDADFRLALTGTPIENRLEELFSLMHFANPGLLGNLQQFKTRFSEPIAAGNSESAGRLRRLIQPFLLRRHKADVLTDLPPRTDSVLWVELDETERRVYDTLLTEARTVISESGESRFFAALEMLLRLRQAACHTGLLPEHNETASSKLECLVDKLEEVIEENHRALVFSQWTSLLDKFEPALTARGIEFARLDGQTQNRQSVVERFQSDAGAPVLLASLQAGGTGLNLTGADHVFLTDPWWNPAVEDQAAGRAHRIGQLRPVFVHRLVAKNTVEERILALQERKRQLGTLVDGAEPTAGLSREELLELLGD